MSLKELIKEIEFAQSIVEYIEKSGFANSKIHAIVTDYLNALKKSLKDAGLMWKEGKEAEEAKTGTLYTKILWCILRLVPIALII